MNEKIKSLFFYDEIYDVKNNYLEIIRGYSHSIEHEIYIKHFTDLEKIEIIKKRQEILERTRLKGVKTNKDALEYLFSENLWTQEKEDEIATLELKVEDNTRQANNMIIPAQRNAIMQLVLIDKENLGKIRQEREALIGLTAEKYADEKYINHYLYFSFFKDPSFKERFFSQEDFDNLEDSEISKYFLIYNEVLKKFVEETFKKIAASPFFLNAVSFAYEDSRLFLDKTSLEYTNYQFEIFNLGKRNIRIISEATQSPPIIHSQTKYDDLINWYELQQAVSETKRQNRDSEFSGIRSTIKTSR